MWQVKQVIALAMLAICAYTDIKEKCIYIMPLIITGVGSVIITVTEMLVPGNGDPVHILITDIVFPILAGAVLVALSCCLKEHLGPGDGYLLAALGLATGIRVDILSFTVAFVAISLYASFVLLSGKRRYVKSVPMAPFVMSGYVMVLFNEV